MLLGCQCRRRKMLSTDCCWTSAALLASRATCGQVVRLNTLVCYLSEICCVSCCTTTAVSSCTISAATANISRPWTIGWQEFPATKATFLLSTTMPCLSRPKVSLGFGSFTISMASRQTNSSTLSGRRMAMASAWFNVWSNYAETPVVTPARHTQVHFF